MARDIVDGVAVGQTDESTGRVIGGRYAVERLLGRGGMAEVYLARDHHLDRLVALKVPMASYATEPAFVARFEREARAAAGLGHSNVVVVYDSGRDGSTPYIVMEYIAGPTLGQVLASQGALPEDEALRLAATIADALGEAHARGIVHCDVKPGNVLLTPGGEPKVTDFGIACAADDSTMTDRTSVMGSARYLAPEQVGHAPVDHRADLYSLGVVLYELLTGRPPFGGRSAVEVALQHTREPVVPPRQLRPEIAAATEAVVLRALAKDPARRYQSADEMRRALEDARDRLTEAPQPSAPPVVVAHAVSRPPTPAASPWQAREPGIEWRRLRPWLLPVAGALLFLLVVAAVRVATPGCVYAGGFAALQAEIPEIVGDCRENEHPDETGARVVQRTTNGVLVWRKADGATYFSDGQRVWIKGPQGLQQRAAGDRFDWEAKSP